ncbi:restriction endonuclease [Williamsia sp. CHRR-6]|uniref:restriction endonuclease n=1 Tax=Williamsia sp. CHRR-6 TaxID=2835871 RepID=UPI001BD9AAE8|nr:restriction endonuclease [Williamsia sp. CHRR-6]MBT0566704.1 restriction endonuclease [Williamsia sp. CHRR-6]
MYIRDAVTAEQNAAARMRDLGFADARTTPPGADKGIDVISESALAQVKWRGAQVPRSDIQRLFGARGTRTHLALLFFSASGYSKAAVECANDLNVMLFEYAPDGSITPRGHAAHHHMQALEDQRRRHEHAERERLRRAREAREREAREREAREREAREREAREREARERAAREHEARDRAARAQSESAPPQWLPPGDQLMWQHRPAQASPHWTPPPQDLSKRRPTNPSSTVRSVGWVVLIVLAFVGSLCGLLFGAVAISFLFDNVPLVNRLLGLWLGGMFAAVCFAPLVFVVRKTRRQKSRQYGGK